MQRILNQSIKDYYDGKIGEARAGLNHVISNRSSSKPLVASAYHYLARTYLREDNLDYSRADDFFMRAQVTSPDYDYSEKNPSIYVERGLTSAVLRQQRTAIENYTFAIEHFPDISFLYTQRGFLHLKEKNIKKATFDFEQAIGLNQENHEAQAGLEAATNNKEIKPLNHAAINTYVVLALDCFSARNYSLAEQYYFDLLRRFPSLTLSSYLIDAFFGMITNENLNAVSNTRRVNVEKNMFNLISQIKEKNLRHTAYLQMLFPQTTLGSLFGTKNPLISQYLSRMWSAEIHLLDWETRKKFTKAIRQHTYLFEEKVFRLLYSAFLRIDKYKFFSSEKKQIAETKNKDTYSPVIARSAFDDEAIQTDRTGLLHPTKNVGFAMTKTHK